MSNIINITLAGHSSSALNSLEDALQDEAEFELSRKLMVEGSVDPFEELPTATSVLVLDPGPQWREVLNAVSSRPARNRVPMILVGPGDNTELVRMALKAGARDFQSYPIVPPELVTTIREISRERTEIHDTGNGELSVFISAKGAAGASALASTVAESITARAEKSNVLLLDMDFQFGNLPIYFDESGTTNLTQAFFNSVPIDQTLLDTCLIKHASGMDILASHSESVFSPWDLQQQSVTNLLNLVLGRYSHVVVDVPRQIDPVSFQAIERAKKICIVMQQSLSDLRYARQIVGLLKDQGVPGDRLMIVVNRFDKNKIVRRLDVEDAFDGLPVRVIPNDYKRMSQVTENAVSLVAKWPSAPITRSVGQLTGDIWPEKPKPKRSFFGFRKPEVVADARI